jgi:hypothetical protein
MLQNPMMATNLRCELLDNPQGIDVVGPRLSWMQNDGRRGAAQSTYRILVASSPFQSHSGPTSIRRLSTLLEASWIVSYESMLEAPNKSINSD